MKVLIVDDSALSRRMLRRSMEELGHICTEACDGVTALERYALEKPDLVVLDLVMPGLSGFDVLQALKGLDPNARVLVCSSDLQTISRDRVKRDGALGMLNKPVTLEQVSAALNAVRTQGHVWSS